MVFWMLGIDVVVGWMRCEVEIVWIELYNRVLFCLRWLWCWWLLVCWWGLLGCDCLIRLIRWRCRWWIFRWRCLRECCLLCVWILVGCWLKKKVWCYLICCFLMSVLGFFGMGFILRVVYCWIFGIGFICIVIGWVLNNFLFFIVRVWMGSLVGKVWMLMLVMCLNVD